MPGTETIDASELERFLELNPNLDAIDAVFPDICGIIRGKRLTLDHARQLFSGGLQMPASMLYLSVWGGCLDPLGMGVSDGDPDVAISPLPGTLRRLPWHASRAQVTIGFRGADGGPHPFEPRNVLSGVAAKCLELGVRPVVACELEFCLLDREPDHEGKPQRPVSRVSGRRHSSTQLMSMSYVDDFSEFANDVLAGARQIDLPVTALNAEYGGDQFEVNLHHVEDAVTAADHAVLLKQLVQGVAASHDMGATFMAKPYAGTAGNGMHWHVSLVDEEGRNLFDDGGESGSETLRNAVGGVLQVLPESMAFQAPNINAFRRFRPGLFVPMTRSWGYNNRSAALRIPGGPSAARRLEFRVAGADANPYLALATLLAGIHHGVAGQLAAPAPITGNACLEPDAGMPLQIHAALHSLEKARVLPAYIGEQYCAVYAACKRLELEDFLDHLSEREYDWYLRAEA